MDTMTNLEYTRVSNNETLLIMLSLAQKLRADKDGTTGVKHEDASAIKDVITRVSASCLASIPPLTAT